MTQTTTPNGGRLATMRRYRRLMFGVLVGGVAVSLVLRYLDYHIVGEAVYLLGFFAFLAIWWGTDITLFDEREQELERHAATITLTATAFVMIFTASAGRLLHAITGSGYPTWLSMTIYVFIGQFVLFGVVYGWLRFRS